MAATQQHLVLALLFAVLAAVAAQQAGGVSSPEPMTEVCLGCVCEAISNCNRTLGCSGEVCGLFRITWAYWSDAGKPVLQNDDPNSEGAYGRCTVDPYCAATVVQRYMQKYAQDCNGDGVVNCYDYARIHLLGGYGCGAPLKPAYEQKFNACMNHVAQLGGLGR